MHMKLIENLELAKATYALVAMANVNLRAVICGDTQNDKSVQIDTAAISMVDFRRLESVYHIEDKPAMW